MPLNQFYVPVRQVERFIAPVAGGLSDIYFIPVEDVASIPDMSSLSFVIDDVGGIVLNAGKQWFHLGAQPRRGYREEPKTADGGPFVEVTVTAVVPFDQEFNRLTLDRLKYHKFIVIVVRPDKSKRIVGSLDNPAVLSFNTDGGQKASDTTTTTITFTAVMQDLPPVYNHAI